MSGNFSKSLTNRKYTFPMESIRVQWITYSGLIGLFTTRLPVFQWKARGYDWSLVDSIGQPSDASLATQMEAVEATFYSGISFSGFAARE